MLMRFKAEDIVGHRLLADGSGVVVVVKSGEDHIEMVYHSAALGEMHRVFGGIVQALADAGVQVQAGHIHAKFPETAGVHIAPTMSPPGVCIVYDAGKPTQVAMAMSALAGRQMGRELISKARAAEQAQRPQSAAPQPEVTK